MKYPLLPIAVVLMPLALLGCGEEHILSADSVDATLVDADTGKPLAGVPVVAYWEVKAGNLTGDGLPCGAAGLAQFTNKNFVSQGTNFALAVAI